MQWVTIRESINCALDVLAIQSIRFEVFLYDVVWCSVVGVLYPHAV